MRSAARALLASGLLMLLATATPQAVDVSKRKGFEIAITSPQDGDFRFGKSEITAEVKIAA